MERRIQTIYYLLILTYFDDIHEYIKRVCGFYDISLSTNESSNMQDMENIRAIFEMDKTACFDMISNTIEMGMDNLFKQIKSRPVIGRNVKNLAEEVLKYLKDNNLYDKVDHYQLDTLLDKLGEVEERKVI